jgi:hypothetical protein
MHTYQELLVRQLETSVDFLKHQRSKYEVGTPQFHQLTKELAQAEVQLVRERIK